MQKDDLPEVIRRKYTPKRKRAKDVADLYRAAGELNLQVYDDAIINYMALKGGKAGVEQVWGWMCNPEYDTPDKLLAQARRELYHYYMYHGGQMDTCGTQLEWTVRGDDAHLTAANFCRDRFCPMCNWRRSLKVFGQISRIMDALETEGYFYLFLTLTVQNVCGEELVDGVQTLYDGWRTLYHDYMRTSGHSAEKRLKGIIKGTFRALEVTVSDGKHGRKDAVPDKWAGTLHHHLHVILAVEDTYFKRGYLRVSDWRDLWRSACNLKYDPIVDIRVVRPKPRSDAAAELELDNGGMDAMRYSAAVAEVSKYPLKDADFVPADRLYHQPQGQYLDWLIKALRGRRLVGFTGCFRRMAQYLKLDDMEGGDLVNVDVDDAAPAELRDDVQEMMIQYRWRAGVYVPTVYPIVKPVLVQADDDFDEGGDPVG